MKNYPLDKYEYYVVTNADSKPYKVVAVSTYAGKTVRGVAVCTDEDEFNLEKGKRIAAADCNTKVAQKRLKRASQKYMECFSELTKVGEAFERAKTYFMDAQDMFDNACEQYFSERNDKI